jgi:hypothetical protein
MAGEGRDREGRDHEPTDAKRAKLDETGEG